MPDSFAPDSFTPDTATDSFQADSFTADAPAAPEPQPIQLPTAGPVAQPVAAAPDATTPGPTVKDMARSFIDWGTGSSPEERNKMRVGVTGDGLKGATNAFVEGRGYGKPDQLSTKVDEHYFGGVPVAGVLNAAKDQAIARPVNAFRNTVGNFAVESGIAAAKGIASLMPYDPGTYDEADQSQAAQRIRRGEIFNREGGLGELLTREAGSFFGGDAVALRPDEPAAVKGVAQLESKVGVVKGAYIQGIAHYIGQAPVLLLNTGLGAAAVPEVTGATMLGTFGRVAAQSAIEGLGQGVGSGLMTPGADVLEQGAAGALVGGALGPVAHAAGHLAGETHAIWAAFMKGEGTQALVNEFEGAISEARNAVGRENKPAVQAAMFAKAPSAPVVVNEAFKLHPDDVSFRTLTPGVEGEVIGRSYAVEYDRAGNALVRHEDIPLRDKKAVANWYRSKHPDAPFIPNKMMDPTQAAVIPDLAFEDLRDLSEAVYYRGPSVADRTGIRRSKFSDSPDLAAEKTRALKSEADMLNAQARFEGEGGGLMKVELRPAAERRAGKVLKPGDTGYKLEVRPAGEAPEHRVPDTRELARGDVVKTADNRVGAVAAVHGNDVHFWDVNARKMEVLPLEHVVLMPRGDESKVVAQWGGEEAFAKTVPPEGKTLTDEPVVNWRPQKRPPDSFVPDSAPAPEPRKYTASKAPEQGPGGFVRPAAGPKSALPGDELLYRLQKLTPERVAAYYGETLDVAGRILKNLEERGLAKYEGGGRWTSNRKPPVRVPDFRAPEGVHEDYAVRMLGGELGIYRGLDKNNPALHLVEVQTGNEPKRIPSPSGQGWDVPNPRAGKPKTEMRSLPAREFNTAVPVTMADRALAQLDPSIGITYPMPREYTLPPSQENANAVRALRKSALGNAMQATVSAAKSFQRFFVNDMYLVPAEARRLAVQASSARPNQRATALQITNTLGRAFGGDLNSRPAQELVRVIEARATAKPGEVMSPRDLELINWANKNPEQANEGLGLIKNLLSEVKDNSAELGLRGLADIAGTEAARNAGAEPEYLAAMYRLFSMRDKWVDAMTAAPRGSNLANTWDKGMEWAVEQVSKKGKKHVSLADVDVLLRQVLRESNPIEAMGKEGLLSPDAKGRLMFKDALDPRLKGLLGEETSGLIRLAHTVSAQRALLDINSTAEALVGSKWFSFGPRSDLTAQIADNKIFGKAAKGYTTPEIAAIFNPKKVDSTTNALSRVFGFVGGKWKGGVTVYGGFQPWVNNAARNIKSMMISGGFSPLDPATHGAYVDAAKMLWAYRSDPSINGPASLLIEAMRFGAVSSGFGQGEISSTQSRLAAKVLRSIAEPRTDFLGAWADVGAYVRDAGADITGEIREAYDAIDRIAKFGTYINLRRQFLAKGMSVHDAAALAAERINQSFPNFDNVGHGVDALRKTTGLLAPFLSAKVEDIRINAMLVSRLARTAANPTAPNAETHLVGKIAQMGLLLGGAAYSLKMQRRMNGISDERLSAAVATSPLLDRSRAPGAVFGTSPDEKGRIPMYNLTSWEDALNVCRGNVDDKLLNLVILNTMKDLGGEGSVVGDALQSVAEHAGMVRPQPRDMPVGEGEGDVGELMRYLAYNGPAQGLTRGFEALKKGGGITPLRPTQEQWTPGQVAQKLGGLPFSGPISLPDNPNGSPTAFRRVKEAGGIRSEMEAEIHRIAADPTLSQADKQRLITTKVQRMTSVYGGMSGMFPSGGGPQ